MLFRRGRQKKIALCVFYHVLDRVSWSERFSNAGEHAQSHLPPVSLSPVVLCGPLIGTTLESRSFWFDCGAVPLCCTAKCPAKPAVSAFPLQVVLTCASHLLYLLNSISAPMLWEARALSESRVKTTTTKTRAFLWPCLGVFMKPLPCHNLNSVHRITNQRLLECIMKK